MLVCGILGLTLRSAMWPPDWVSQDQSARMLWLATCLAVAITMLALSLPVSLMLRASVSAFFLLRATISVSPDAIYVRRRKGTLDLGRAADLQCIAERTGLLLLAKKGHSTVKVFLPRDAFAAREFGALRALFVPAMCSKSE